VWHCTWFDSVCNWIKYWVSPSSQVRSGFNLIHYFPPSCTLRNGWLRLIWFLVWFCSSYLSALILILHYIWMCTRFDGVLCLTWKSVCFCSQFDSTLSLILYMIWFFTKLELLMNVILRLVCFWHRIYSISNLLNVPFILLTTILITLTMRFFFSTHPEYPSNSV